MTDWRRVDGGSNRKVRRPGRAPASDFAFFASFAVSLCLLAATGIRAEESPDPSVRLYDTAAQSKETLSDAVVAAKRGWKEIAGGTLDHVFQGDAALLNDRLLLILRACADGADVYSARAAGFTFRTELAAYPAAQPLTRRLASARILENNSGAVMVDATYKTGDGRSVAVRYRLAAGQAILEVRPGDGAQSLVVLTDGGPLVVPDFFGDDMVFAGGLRNHEPVGLPAENMFLNLMDGGNAIAMYVWQARNLQVKAVLGKHPGVLFSGCEAGDVKGRPIWLAFFEAPGLWHERPVKFADEGTTVTLDWKPPFAAKWRAALVRPDHTADSWFFRAADEKEPGAAASPARLDGDRATVAIPPPAKAEAGVDPRVGPLLVYPLDRTRTTPLTEFTPVDILRNTLGVGPCQYILEAEGLASQDNPTPDQVMMWVEKQFRKKGGKDAAEEIKERLKAMTEHVGRARARLKAYHDFAASAGALVRVLGTSPEAGRLAEETSPTFARIVQASADGLAATDPARLAKSADEAAALVGREDAAAQLQRPATEIRAAGAALDRALARCRMAARWLGVQVAGAGLKDQGEAETARQVQALAEQVLKGK